ncbi:phage tail assembly chaperone, partial [Dryocola boscaweniae]
TGEPVDKEWAEYRQNLRDISEQAGYPFKIHWPGQPSS